MTADDGRRWRVYHLASGLTAGRTGSGRTVTYETRAEAEAMRQSLADPDAYGVERSVCSACGHTRGGHQPWCALA